MNLGDIITVADSEKCGNREFPVLSMTMHDGLVLQTDRFKKAIASKDLSGYKVVRRNQLVVSFPIDEGVLYIQDVVDAGIVSPAYAVWDVRTDMICPKFLGMFLRCPKSIQYYKAKLRGSTARRRTIPRDDFLAMSIPAFSISDQDRICAILEKIWSVIAASTKQIDILEELVKSRFVEMFGGCLANTPLIEFGKVFTGSTPSMKEEAYYHQADFCFVKPSDLSYDVRKFSDSECHLSYKAETVARMFNPGAVLVTCIGATIGKMGIAQVRGSCNQQINFIEPFDNVDSSYLAYAIQSRHNELVSIANSTAVPIINKSEFCKFKIPLPPLALQREFAAFVAKVDKLAFAARRRRDLAQQMYRAKIQEFFG